MRWGLRFQGQCPPAAHQKLFGRTPTPQFRVLNRFWAIGIEILNAARLLLYRKQEAIRCNRLGLFRRQV